jgi:hypothetical protein
MLRLLAAVAGLLFLTGCLGYRLGPTNGVSAGAKSIEVVPFFDETFEPRLGDAVTTSLRRNLQRDGTFHLATHGTPDLVVSGVLKQYSRRELSFSPHDVLTVRDYRVNVKALITVRDLANGTVTTNTVTGYTLLRVGSDLASAERQALPVLADDLAKNIMAMVVDGSW